MAPSLNPPPGAAQRLLYADPAAAGAAFEGESAICVGTFDGVHRGHQAILVRGQQIARERNLRLIVVTFHPHPKSIVAPDRAPKLLADPEEKLTLLCAHGAEAVVQLHFDAKLAATPAELFLNNVLRKQLRASALIVGHDFGFGHHREGTPDLLRTWGQKTGCQVEVVEPVMDSDLNDRISSSLIRRFLTEGQFETAIRLLGHPYPVSGPILPGDGRGRKIGYPTWNLHLREYKLPPPVGIYAGWAGRSTPRPAMAYYGSNPTFGKSSPRVEAHLIDAGGHVDPAAEETIWLGAFVRKEVQFDSAEALTRQLAEDQRIVRNILSTGS